MRTKIKIICHVHGVFEQLPSSHLYGHGCLVCSGNKKKDTKTFVDDSTVIHHGVYDYSLVEYINSNVKVDIICKKNMAYFHKNQNTILRERDVLNVKPLKVNVK